MSSYKIMSDFLDKMADELEEEGVEKVEEEPKRETFTISEKEARAVGGALGVDFTRISLSEFKKGIGVEMERSAGDTPTELTEMDLKKAGKTAWAHLQEIADYYTQLEMMEEESTEPAPKTSSEIALELDLIADEIEDIIDPQNL